MLRQFLLADFNTIIHADKSVETDEVETNNLLLINVLMLIILDGKVTNLIRQICRSV